MKKFVATTLVLFLFAGAAFAASPKQGVDAVFPMAKAAYTAEDSTTYNDSGYNYKIFYSPGKQRSEFDIVLKKGEKIPAIVINRIDKKLTWSLQPNQKTYVTGRNKDKVPTANLQVDGMINIYLYNEVRQTRVKEEDVNGVKAVKFEVRLKSSDGSTVDGFVWRTKDDIIVKVELTETPVGGQPAKLVRELKNVKVGPVDEKLFEVPSGFVEAVSGPH